MAAPAVVRELVERFDAHKEAVDTAAVRKAGGVYYTPAYIVDYIVRNTVGDLLERGRGVTPTQAADLRVLDPACGAGAFLIGAYRYLLDWHRDWYVEHDAQKHARARNPRLYRGPAGDWRLTTAEKKRILFSGIYGVDIDPQAVEVTKLSLLLKVLEGESKETVNNQLRLVHERALPDLGSNIKCGNSLIGPDFYDTRGGLSQFSFDENGTVPLGSANLFDWLDRKRGFGAIMAAGGFDAVIGNPPYIPIETMEGCHKDYYRRCFPELQRKFDSSVVFILAMLRKLRPGGRLGFISSLTWQTGENYSRLREHLFTRAGVVRLVNLPFDVFGGAYVDTGVYILSRAPSKEYGVYRFPKKQRAPDMRNLRYTVVKTRLVAPPDYKIVLEPRAQAILLRIAGAKGFVPFGDFTRSTQGLASNRFPLTPKTRSEDCYPFLARGQVYRYALRIDKVAHTAMDKHRSLRQFYDAVPKILIRRVINRADRLMATYFDRKLVFKKDVNPFVITGPEWDPFYVLGILNSALGSYLYVNTSSIATKDDFRQTTLAELRRLPIPVAPRGSKQRERMVDLVKGMLSLHKRLAAARTAQDKTALLRQIAAADRQIDALVCQLYALSDEEIAIVEKAAAQEAYHVERG